MDEYDVGHLDDDDHQDDDGHGWWPEAPAAPRPAVQDRFDGTTAGNIASSAARSRRMNRRPANRVVPAASGARDFSPPPAPARRASSYARPMVDGFRY